MTFVHYYVFGCLPKHDRSLVIKLDLPESSTVKNFEKSSSNVKGEFIL